MKYLIASDIHGSAFYCEKMLMAFESENADKILLLGDILYHGPRNDLPKDYAPKKVIEMLNALKDKILCVRGNCDTEVDQMVLQFPILGLSQGAFTKLPLQLFFQIPEHLDQFILIHRFHQVVAHLITNRLLGISEITIAAENNRLDVRLDFVQLLDHLQAAHSAHQDIRQNSITGMFSQIVQCISAIAKCAYNLKTDLLPGNETFQTMSDVIFIFNDH